MLIFSNILRYTLKMYTAQNFCFIKSQNLRKWAFCRFFYIISNYHIIKIYKNINYHFNIKKYKTDPSKKLQIELPYNPVLPLLVLSKEYENTNCKRQTHASDQCRIIYNSQGMEAT